MVVGPELRIGLGNGTDPGLQGFRRFVVGAHGTSTLSPAGMADSEDRTVMAGRKRVLPGRLCPVIPACHSAAAGRSGLRRARRAPTLTRSGPLRGEPPRSRGARLLGHHVRPP
ncbi:hypothetical protein SPW_4810 [Streptomyces sp. W007]|nr:hypothetical protein SPW_4810 [Streptomyces sp. W007]